MAIITRSVNRLYVVSDLFDSFHAVQDARSKLKDKNYPDESVLEFVELTANDDKSARTDMLKDLGFLKKEIGFFDKALSEGKILICVDALAEERCEKVEEILIKAGGLKCETPKEEEKSVRKKRAAPRRSKVQTEIKVSATEAEL